ncbi:hypothetical protein [Streptomyces acidiscabies]|uniref:hypothetical protein n=1 Tax=Streptomyces acidiscabies TaxID=42234 RepID=UPI0009529A13|nr:hypothetical protein [Streptomyces acidiscabies]
MTARVRAYACYTGAVACLAAGLAVAPYGALYSIPGILAAALLVWVGVGYWDDHRADLLRHEQARRDALRAFPAPHPHTDGQPLNARETVAWIRLVGTLHLPAHDPRETP